MDLGTGLGATAGRGLLPVDAQVLHDALAEVELHSLQWLAARTLTSGADDAPAAVVTRAPAPVRAPAAVEDDLTLF